MICLLRRRCRARVGNSASGTEYQGKRGYVGILSKGAINTEFDCLRDIGWEDGVLDGSITA